MKNIEINPKVSMIRAGRRWRHVAATGLTRTLPVAMLAAMHAALPTGCWTSAECGPETAVVERVVDGDTLDLADGTRIRVLGIDAPESTACWGPQATATAKSMLEGRTVRLRYAGECVDAYGRTLASLTVDGIDAATELTIRGAACAWILQDFSGAADVRRAARQAAATGTGLWGACDPVPCRSN